MGKLSFQGTLTDWEGLLSAIEANQGEIPNIEVYAAQLAAAVRDLKEIRARKAALRSELRELTQSFLGKLAFAADLAIRTRSWVRAWYGAYNDKLKEFGIEPIRKRGPRRKPAPAGAEDEAPRYPTSTVR